MGNGLQRAQIQPDRAQVFFTPPGIRRSGHEGQHHRAVRPEASAHGGDELLLGPIADARAHGHGGLAGPTYVPSFPYHQVDGVVCPRRRSGWQGPDGFDVELPAKAALHLPASNLATPAALTV
ncbi:MAG: hypothetical protein ACETWR_19515 [Anaerolineae bacterium]